MQISCENIELLQDTDFAQNIYSQPNHNLQAQTVLEKLYGKSCGRFAIMQRKILPKAYKKIPTWHKHQCFFTPKSFEQSTSETVAMVKSSLFGTGKSLLSLTGGLGVDDWALSKNYDRIISLDTDPDLNRIVQINLKKLGVNNVERRHDSAEKFLKKTNIRFDNYYLDPDRRDKKNAKGLDVSAFSPNLIELLKSFPEIKKNLWIKLSPATDLTWVRKNIHGEVDIYIIEHQGEVKEILCHFSPSMNNRLEIISIQSKIHKINKKSSVNSELVDYEVLWEPSPALIKSNFLHNTELGSLLAPCNENLTLFKGNRILPKAYGRFFKIILYGDTGMKQVKKELVKLGIERASVTTKTYPLKPADIMKTLKLKESSTHQLYFTTYKGKKNWYITEKI